MAVGESRDVAPATGEAADKPDLLRVALAAWAAHLHKRAGAGVPVIPRGLSPWGRSARMAAVQRSNSR